MYDLCDMCFTSGVTVGRTTRCGKTIGIECGCDEVYEDGKCSDSDCTECSTDDADAEETDGE